MVDNKKLQISFFFILFGLVSVVVFQIFRPFLEVILFAAVLAVILQPIFSRLLGLTHENREISAAATILILATFIAIPVYLLGVQMVKDSSNIYTSIVSDGAGAGVLASVSIKVDNAVNQIFPDLGFRTETYVGSFIGIISQNIGGFISGTAFALLEVLLILLSLFFFLKDGPFFVKGFTDLSPLDDRYDREIMTTLTKTTYSVLRGALAIAVIQGIILMVGFAIFGVPNAVLWGSLAMVSAVVPGIGTAIIFVPGILYLFYTHQAAAAVGLLLWSFFIHGSIDNFLAPMLYGKRMSIHPVFIMFSVLGGLAYFGPPGFLFGPIVFSVFTALFRIYRILILEGEKSQ